MNNFQKRILTAVIGVPLILLVLYLGGFSFLIFTLAVISLGIIEFFRIVNLNEYKSVKILIFIACILIAIGAFNCSFLMMGLFTLSILTFMMILLKKSNPAGLITALGLFTFPVLYFGWMFSHSLLLRNISFQDSIASFARDIQGLSDPGFFFIVLVIATTFLNDTGAYFVGKWKGTVKLAPRISPGKTVEGTLSGIVIAVITALVINLIFFNPLELVWALVFGFITAVSAVTGDLFESSIKRGMGVKDSGDILPGHGGIMDRFDSLFFVFPVSYYLVVLYYYSKGVDFF